MDKICTKCKVCKNYTDFHKDKTHKDGLRSFCKSCVKEYQKKNADRIIETAQLYRQTHKEKIKIRKKEYIKTNREKIRLYDRKRQKHKRETDIHFKIKQTIRLRLGKAINNNQKRGSAVADLGCSVSRLKEHLQQQFYDHPKTGEKMTWENHSHNGWHIDHVKSLASFDLTDRNQFLEACHYTNLQPLWAKENYAKGDKNEA